MTTSITPADVLAHGHAVLAHHIKLAEAATKVDLAASLAIEVIAAEALRAGGALEALCTLAPEVQTELTAAHSVAAFQMRQLREALIAGSQARVAELIAAYGVSGRAEGHFPQYVPRRAVAEAVHGHADRRPQPEQAPQTPCTTLEALPRAEDLAPQG